MIMGLITALLIVIFCAIVGWAYSSRRKNEFERMARVPLDDDQSEKRS
jgi:cytochrome c oxidase cbb3-type subunit 4